MWTDVRCMIAAGKRNLFWRSLSRRTVEPCSLVDLCSVHSYVCVCTTFPSCGLCGDAARVVSVAACDMYSINPKFMAVDSRLACQRCGESVACCTARMCRARHRVLGTLCVLFCLFGCLESFPSCREFVVRALMLSFRAVALKAKLPTLTAPSASAVPSFHSTRPAPVAVRAPCHCLFLVVSCVFSF
jgi:hypothetical protein